MSFTLTSHVSCLLYLPNGLDNETFSQSHYWLITFVNLYQYNEPYVLIESLPISTIIFVIKLRETFTV